MQKLNDYVTITVNHNLSNFKIVPKKLFVASMGLEPVASGFALKKNENAILMM